MRVNLSESFTSAEAEIAGRIAAAQREMNFS
jgi:hypothetical protein